MNHNRALADPYTVEKYHLPSMTSIVLAKSAFEHYFTIIICLNFNLLGFIMKSILSAIPPS